MPGRHVIVSPQGKGLAITTSALPNGTQGIAYSFQLAAAGGTGAQTWTLFSQTGNNTYAVSSSGLVTCSPTVVAGDTLQVATVDSLLNHAIRTLPVSIGSSLQFTTTSLPGATQGSVYSFQLVVTGGTTPYVFTLNSQSGPNTVAVSSTGLVTFTPSATGADTINVSVTDAHPTTVGPQAFTITVSSAVVSTSVVFNPGDYMKSYTQYSYGISGSRGEIQRLVAAGNLWNLNPTSVAGIKGYVWIDMIGNYWSSGTFDNSITDAQNGTGGWVGFGQVDSMLNYLQWQAPGLLFGMFFDSNNGYTSKNIGGDLSSFDVPDAILNHASFTYPSTATNSAIPQFGSSFTTVGSLAAQPNGQYGYLLNDFQQRSSGTAYNSGTAYTVGQLVLSSGFEWYCKTNTTGNAPPTSGYTSNTWWQPYYQAQTGWALWDPVVSNAYALFWQAFSYHLIPAYPTNNYNAGTMYNAGNCVLYLGNPFMFNGQNGSLAGQTPPSTAGTGNANWDPYSIPASSRGVTYNASHLRYKLGTEDEVALAVGGNGYSPGGAYSQSIWDQQYLKAWILIAQAFPNTPVQLDYSYGPNGSTTASMYAFVQNLWKGAAGVGNIVLSASDMFPTAWVAASGHNCQTITTQLCAIGFNGTETPAPYTNVPAGNGIDSRPQILLGQNCEVEDYSNIPPTGVTIRTAQMVEAIGAAATTLGSPFTNGGLGCHFRDWDATDTTFNQNVSGGPWPTYILPGILLAQANYPVIQTRPKNIALPTNYMGGNLQGLSYFDSEIPFLNVLKMTNGGQPFSIWDTSGSDTPQDLKLDANGYPTSLTGYSSTVYSSIHTTVFTNMLNQGAGTPPGVTTPYPIGSYTFTCTGKFTLTFSGDVQAGSLATSSAGASVSGLQLTSTSTGIVTATFNIASASIGGTGIRFDITAIPDNVNYPRNMSLVQAAYISNFEAGEILHPLFKASIQTAGYKRERFMDMLNTNGQTPQVTFTGAPGSGATSATIASIFIVPNGATYPANWAFPTGTYVFVFSDGSRHNVSCTNGSPNVIFSALSSAVTNTAYWVVKPSWSARNTVTNVSWGGYLGVPEEIILAMCNELAIDPWYCYPISIDSTYIANTAAMFFNGAGATTISNDTPIGSVNATYQATSGLSTAQKAHVEFSNEIWNAGFQAFNFANLLGSVVFPTASNEALSNWQGMSTANIGDVWFTTYGSSNTVFNARVCVSMGGQAATGNGSFYMGVAMNTAFWTSAAYTHHVGAMHFAPYFSPGLSNGDQTTLLAQSNPLNAFFGLAYSNVYGGVTYSSLASNGYIGAAISTSETIFAALAGNGPWSPGGTAPVPILGYESGAAFVGAGSVSGYQALLYSASRDARMSYIYYDPNHVLSSNNGYLPGMIAAGYQSINQYNNCQYYSSGGNWGALESVMQPITPLANAPPEYQGIQNWIAA